MLQREKGEVKHALSLAVRLVAKSILVSAPEHIVPASERRRITLIRHPFLLSLMKAKTEREGFWPFQSQNRLFHHQFHHQKSLKLLLYFEAVYLMLVIPKIGKNILITIIAGTTSQTTMANIKLVINTAILFL
jgi:hypothetical protein